MSSPEYEGFGMTDNDVMDAMDPLRRQRKRTKEETIYGMWADSGSDDESSGRAGLGMPGKSGKADYSRPVSFVSGGLKKTQEEMAMEEDQPAASSHTKTSQKGPRFSGVKKVGGAGSSGQGDWERHTKGVGKRLLAKMGWEQGQGLGKNLQGISAPVEAFVRKGKGALGFYGSEKTEPVAPVVKETKVTPKTELLPQQLGQWKKAPGEKKKVRYVVRSAADIAAEGDYRNQRSGAKSQTLDSAITSVKVIDLTGKEKVVYSGYSSLSRHHMVPDDDRRGFGPQSQDDDRIDPTKPSYFDVPELRHNLKLLVTSAEDEVIENLRIRDRENDQVACLAHDRQRLDEVIDDEERLIDQLRLVVTLVNQLDSVSSINDAMSLLSKLETDHETEYKLYGLDRLLYSVSEPLLKVEFVNWDPLKHDQSDCCFQSLYRLRQAFLSAEESSASGVGIAQFDALIWEIWLPPVRLAIINRWNPRDPESLVYLFDMWHQILPSWIWENICDQLLVPRILTEAENWNPVTDTLPIHSWIHPWLSLLADKLEPVYLPIRQKIGTALASWHPSDPSARILLSSWVKVWSDGHMRSFLLQHIGPKLANVMQEFVINPRQQQLEPWKWVFDWIDLLPLPYFVSILDKYFFPKWLVALASWLDSSADYQEVSKWYMGWKSTIPSQLLNEPIIKESLGKALAMMNQAMSGGRAEAVLMASSTSVPAASTSALHQIPVPPQPVSVPVSFKELIERRAEATGLLFLPLNRRDGQQMYQLGRVHLYMDRNVVFVHSGGTWVPVSVDDLFTMA